ncbi:MAG: phage scaffolding protein [Clostridia bacterium]|nr:phage scaffolding protein [Clostridia bacterium]
MNTIKFLTEILEEKGITLEEDVLSAIEGAIGERFVTKDEYNGMLLEGHLKTALAKSGAKSEKAIWGFIDKNSLKLENGELKGFDSQLAEIKKEHGYLFEDMQTSTGFNHQSGMSIDYDSLSDEEYYKLKERN